MASLASAVLKKAHGRKRCRCNNETTYSHGNLVDWLTAGLPAGWHVEMPPPDAEAPSQFPASNDLEAQDALQGILPALLGTSRGYEDEIDGHCETVSVVLSGRVVQELRKADGRTPSQILACAYDSLAKELRASTVAEQVKTLFSPLVKSGRHLSNAEMWAELKWPIQPTPVQLSPEDYIAAMCAGVTTSLLPRLTVAIREAKDEPFVFPLYVLNYIWDVDELRAWDLQWQDIETAQYSIHCIGLVVDCKSSTVYMADPNGALVKGGSTELLEIPFTLLTGQRKPTTSVSRWDWDQLTGVSASSTTVPGLIATITRNREQMKQLKRTIKKQESTREAKLRGRGGTFFGGAEENLH